jgi:hypothetical protein
MDSTNGITLAEFQEQVSDLLLRHRSLLDVLSKTTQTSAAVNRAVAKAITECGCIELHARKQEYPEDANWQSMQAVLTHHIIGELCESCREAIISEIGRNLFYMSALGNLLNIRLEEEVITAEAKKCSTLGLFNCT